MNKDRSVEIFISIVLVGLLVIFAPKLIKLFPVPVIPDNPLVVVPLSPKAEQLRSEILPLLATDESKNDARLLGSCVKSTANLFLLDAQRSKPFYASLEARKWAIRRTDETTFGLGFSVKAKYPELAEKMKEFMVSECGEAPTPEVLNDALLTLGLALESM